MTKTGWNDPEEKYAVKHTWDSQCALRRLGLERCAAPTQVSKWEETAVDSIAFILRGVSTPSRLATVICSPCDFRNG